MTKIDSPYFQTDIPDSIRQKGSIKGKVPHVLSDGRTILYADEGKDVSNRIDRIESHLRGEDLRIRIPIEIPQKNEDDNTDPNEDESDDSEDNDS